MVRTHFIFFQFKIWYSCRNTIIKSVQLNLDLGKLATQNGSTETKREKDIKTVMPVFLNKTDIFERTLKCLSNSTAL